MVLRDPRDVLLSGTCQTFGCSSDKIKNDRGVDYYVRALGPTVAWVSYRLAFLIKWSSTPTLVVLYENLVHSPKTEYRRIAKFLGLDSGIDEEALQKLIKSTSAAAMREQEAAGLLVGGKSKTQRMAKKVREGRPGRHREVLRDELLRYTNSVMTTWGSKEVLKFYPPTY